MSVRAIVLAAGKGTRMKSATPKVLHQLCGRPMLWYSLRALRDAGIEDVVVVTNDELQPQMEQFGVRGIVQTQQLGTGHAVKIALDAMDARDGGRVIVAYGDMPLVTPEIFTTILESLSSAAMSLVTVRMPLIRSSMRAVCQRHHAIEWLPLGGTKWSCSSVPFRASFSAPCAKSSPR